MCGVETKIVTSVDVSGLAANDTPYFVPLLERTAKHFQMQEVSADKAYLSYANLAAVAKANATPFIPCKVNTAVPKDNSSWAEMYHYFMYNRAGFLEKVLDHDPSHADITALLLRLKTALHERNLELKGITTDGSALSPD